ncbi:MAG: acyloxyacyl hydrolase [Bacteroidales bacterium]|nr:acyloxyacyl hydrolase [Bacteroidales bacterium]
MLKPVVAIIMVLMAGLITTKHLSAQKVRRFQAANLLFEPRANYGFLIAHHVEMEIYNSHFPSFEFTIAQASYGKRQWESYYNYPVTGIAYWNAWLGNSRDLGQAHALFPYISFPWAKNEKSELNFRLGAGLAYLTKRFDRLENYKYTAIGSHLNAAINLMIEYRWKPLHHLQLSAGVQLMHFSNGSVKTPNFGLNIPSVSGGIAFRLNKENNYIRRRLRPDLTMFEFDGSDYIEIKAGSTFAIKETGDTEGKRYNIYAGFISASKSLGYKHKLGLCFDLSWDGSDALLVAHSNTEPYHKSELTKPGISAAYELVLARTSFAFNLGAYLGGKDKSEGMTYYKAGIHYLITKNLFANLTLKTHYARADFVGLGIGYRFKLKYYMKL